MAKGNPNPSPETRFQPGHALSRKHGGESAVKKIRAGEALTGPAREYELAIREELEVNGRAHLVRRGAIRLEAAARCYWAAINKVMALVEDQGYDQVAALGKLDSYVARFGWLQSSALRAWKMVREEEKDGFDSRLADYEVILREADD